MLACLKYRLSQCNQEDDEGFHSSRLRNSCVPSNVRLSSEKRKGLAQRGLFFVRQSSRSGCPIARATAKEADLYRLSASEGLTPYGNCSCPHQVPLSRDVRLKLGDHEATGSDWMHWRALIFIQ